MAEQPDSQSSLSARLVRQFRDPTLVATMRGRDASSYEFRVWSAANQIDECVKELRQHLFSGFRSVKTIHQARIAIKVYIISWRTLSDTVALLISESFDLGLSLRDTKLDLVTRNSHVCSSGVDKVLLKYENLPESKRFRKIRNQIIHQAFLDDPQLDELAGQFKCLKMGQLLGLKDLDVESKQAKDKLKVYVATKKQEFSNHLDRTEQFLDDIANSLSEVVQKRSNADESHKQSERDE